MSKLYKTFVAALILGLALTGFSLLISPKDTVTTGPSCPICLDIDGGTYHDTERGWPLRFLHQDDGYPGAGGDEFESRTEFNPVGFVGNWALWSVISGIAIAIVQKTRRTK